MSSTPNSTRVQQHVNAPRAAVYRALLNARAVQMIDHLLLGHVQMLSAPGAGGMQNPSVQRVVTSRFAAVASQPVEWAVLYEAAFHGRIQRCLERQRDSPGRVHFHPGGGTGEFRCGGQQCSRLRRRRGDDHMTERAVGEAFGVLKMPVFLAAIDLGNAAGEMHFQVAEQATGDGAHARRADPASLFVRRQAELAAMVGVELRHPFGNPAVALPALDFSDEATVAGSEILRAQVQSTRIAALARHASATAAAFIEKLNDMPDLCQGLGGGESGDAGADDCDRYSHRGLVYLSVQTTPWLKPVQYCFSV